jgi:hypothetical protein
MKTNISLLIILLEVWSVVVVSTLSIHLKYVFYTLTRNVILLCPDSRDRETRGGATEPASFASMSKNPERQGSNGARSWGRLPRERADKEALVSPRSSPDGGDSSRYSAPEL